MTYVGHVYPEANCLDSLFLDKLFQRMSFLQLPFFGVEVQCLIRRVNHRRTFQILDHQLCIHYNASLYRRSWLYLTGHGNTPELLCPIGLWGYDNNCTVLHVVTFLVSSMLKMGGQPRNDGAKSAWKQCAVNSLAGRSLPLNVLSACPGVCSSSITDHPLHILPRTRPRKKYWDFVASLCLRITSCTIWYAPVWKL